MERCIFIELHVQTSGCDPEGYMCLNDMGGCDFGKEGEVCLSETGVGACLSGDRWACLSGDRWVCFSGDMRVCLSGDRWVCLSLIT